MKGYLTTEEVSKKTMLKKSTVRNYVSKGIIDRRFTKKYGKITLYSENYIEQWIKERLKPVQWMTKNAKRHKENRKNSKREQTKGVEKATPSMGK